MDKLGTKIPMLLFFLGIVYFASDGYGAVDAIVRSFIFAFGVALIILVLMILLMFFLTLQTNRADNARINAAVEHVRDVPVHEKKVEMQP